ncbi:YvrJ family protein [Heliobacterium undosum]|uniref:YvrJ family protein n=1 Tax=Heliomicrobium undosum TaxID=121734 RepID=A0A845L702_9FIRM|nr:YvrJ family protein [Heliomicrobium undosum]MZP31049.1 YvrJ family protein [Heliomicrobium undosum]
MDTVLQSVANVGFPVALAAYLLVRMEGRLEALTGAISELTKLVEILKEQV